MNFVVDSYLTQTASPKVFWHSILLSNCLIVLIERKKEKKPNKIKGLETQGI